MQENRHVALVTGASRGLGEVIAGVLADRGWRVIIGGRDVADLDRVAADLRKRGGEIAIAAGEITDASTRVRMVESAETFGGLDVLVNNASALGPIGPLAVFDVTRFSRLFPVNVGAPLILIQNLLPLLERRHGLIVNITSDAATAAYPGWGPYAATKAALEVLTQTLAVELAERHVAAVVVDPGDMRTRLHQEAFPGTDISDRPLPTVTEPFWRWLFEQTPRTVSGRRFLAQSQEAAWPRP